ncbi:MAG: FISUMP domain-containing protein [Bacteroidota bacterium]
MKYLSKSIVFFILFSLCILSACEKKEIPTVETTEITEITATSAISGGDISSDGNSSVTARGVCYSTNTNPTISDNLTSNDSGIGTFTSNLSGLNVATTYFVRAYATNEEGTGYGSTVSFTTLGALSSASNLAATDITINSALLNGVVNPNNLSTTVTFEYGTTTEYGQTITATTSPLTGNSETNISASISGLSPGTTYHFRVKAVNELGTTNGSDKTFTTLGQVPTVETEKAIDTTTNSASLNGTVNSNYLLTTVTFEYGISIDYGSSVAATQSPVSGSFSTNISVDISNLLPGTTYHFRVKAVNELGTTYGNDMTFTTLGQAPTVTIYPAITLLSGLVTLSGTVNPNYLSTAVTFEYGTTTNYGQTAIATQSPVLNSLTNVSINISGLTGVTTYHFRITATNSLGTTYSDDMTFTVYNWILDTVTDYDGNTYYTIKIGTQVWMAENLKTTKYNDGTFIPNVTDNASWEALTTPAYCWYNNASSYKVPYGALYNWYTVITGKLCPTDWHIPNDIEWSTLTTYLGGESIAGNKLKEAGTTHWRSPNTGATNESGFTALPSGLRQSGFSSNISWDGVWWSITEYSIAAANYRSMNYDYIGVFITHDYKFFGYSVRCVKD